MVKMRDVAREAGVSEAAVSFAINGTGSLSEETRQSILSVVKRLNYKPNSTARKLATKKTNTIGLIIPKPGQEFVDFVGMDIISGIGKVASDRGYNILLAWEDEMGSSKVLELVENGSVGGLTFFLPLNDQKTFQHLNDMNFPYVLMSRAPSGLPCNWVDVDNVDASYQATLLLIKAGHRRIAFIGPGPTDLLVSSDRHTGYRQALLNYNIPYDESIVFLGLGNIESGRLATEGFMALSEPPTALITGSSMPAMGVIEKIKELGLEVPKDLVIITFDNSYISENYGITAIDIPTHEIAQQSANLLFKKIPITHRTEPENIVIKHKLVVRNTFTPLE
ncbi:LacI family DNA-binding transcriptional regulator [Cohnella endophytica]|nr:LacI family DNA-binding transcriptional regulator [Cohnella endophytica]